jgi:hypothetical protein
MDDTQCPKADNLFTSNLSTDYLHLLPDLHHIFVGLTQVEATHIVTMAPGEIQPINLATEQPSSETSVFKATDKPHLSMKGGNNDVATNPQETLPPTLRKQLTRMMPPTRKGRRLKLHHQPLKQRSPSLHQPETKLKGGLMMKPQWNKVLSVPDANPTGHLWQTSTRSQN